MEFPAGRSTTACWPRWQRLRRRHRRRHPGARQARAHGRAAEVKNAALAQLVTEDSDPERVAQVKRAVAKLEKEIIRRRIAVEKRARRPRRRRDPADHLRGRRRPAHARLRPLHPRPDPGPHPAHPGRHGRAAHRRPRHRGVEALHAPLQVPALQRGRDRLHARPRPARDRSRRPRRAGPAAGHPRRGGVPLHHPPGLRDPRVQRLRSMASVCGSTLALMDAGVPISAPGGRHRHGSHQGGRRLRRAHRHRRRGRPPGRHGLQGGRHRRGHHRPADGHQDQGRDLRDHDATRSSRPARPACSSSARWPRPSPSRAASSPSSRRASPPSASTPRRSARSSARAARPSAA